MAVRRPGVADILYVMATEHEFGPELRSRITPLMTGVGPIEAAMAVTERLTRLEIEDKLPLIVVSLGSAGSDTLEQCGLYQASDVSWRDIDASALGFDPGIVPFADLPAILPLGPFVPGIPTATLSTGADIVTGVAYKRIDAEMGDMETYAVLRACQRFCHRRHLRLAETRMGHGNRQIIDTRRRRCRFDLAARGLVVAFAFRPVVDDQDDAHGFCHGDFVKPDLRAGEYLVGDLAKHCWRTFCAWVNRTSAKPCEGRQAKAIIAQMSHSSGQD